MKRASPHGFVAFLPLLIWAASAYNVHLGAPAVSVKSTGRSDELFGFSVALHQFANGSTVNLVGAPKVNSSGVLEGGVYVCPTATGSSCYQEPLFNSRQDPYNDPGLSLNDPTNYPEADFNGQLLGYTVRSFASHVIACAPLFIGQRASGNAVYTGRCVLFPHDFGPGDSPDQITLGTFTASPQPDGLLMGLGAAFLSEDIASSVFAIGFGYSGNFAGGAAYSIQVDRGSRALSVVNDQFYNTQFYNDLLGYHIEVGHVTSLTSYATIIGAPRGSGHLGNVFVTEFIQMAPLFTITGKQSDGHFGFSFAVCNWATGGYDSIVVGCPLCDGDVGRVYVYMHSGNPANPYPSTQEITPPTIVAGRFGLSVANAGDLDQDGYDDIAIAAPHDGGGVVYIYRGCEYGLYNPPQVIRPTAVSQTSLFGYKLSALVDVDRNSYPDLSATDMSGTVYTFRTNPLVAVDATFTGLAPTLNLNMDTCRVGSFSAACFNFSLCFQYRPLVGEDIGTFAFSYTLLMDQPLGRVVQRSALPVTAELTLSRNTTRCTDQFYYFLKPGSDDTTSPITVQIVLQDAKSPLSLPTSTQSTQLGGSLTPLLRRFVNGSHPGNIVNQSISLITGCGGGICKPNYVVHAKKEGSEAVLISSEPFYVSVTIQNTANQSSIAPQLFIDVPSGVAIYGGNTNTTNIDGVQDCVPLTITQFKCSLSLIQPFSSLQPTIPFILDPTTFGVNLLTREALPTFTMNFTIGQNYSSEASSMLSLALDAQAQYTVTSSTNEAEYVAFSLTSSSLSGQGPAVKYTVKVTNSLTGGTTIPNSTLYIYWPTYFKSPKGLVPLLVATKDSSPSAPCKHYNTIPSEVSRFNATLPQQYDSKPTLPSKYLNSETFGYGVITCNIQNLAAQGAVDVIIVSQLWSTSVVSPLVPSIEAAIVSGSLLPRFIGGKPSDNVTVMLSPGVKEFPVACFPIWIIIVAVVGGFVCLGIIGILIGCGLLVYRFIKTKKYDVNDPDNPDNGEYDCKLPRTIPPIPGLNSMDNRPSSFQYIPVESRAPSQDPEALREALRKEKDKEMEEELQLQAKLTHTNDTMSRLITQSQPKQQSEAPPSGDGDPFETTL